MKKTHPTLVLIPGLLSDSIVWHSTAEAVLDRLPVHNADVSTLTSISGSAQQLLDQVPGPLVLVGHSMGGRIALEMARLAPQRIQGLVLADTGVHPKKDGEQDSRETMIELAYRKGMPELADTWLPPMVHPSRHNDNTLMTALREMVLRMSAEQHEQQMRALLERPPAHEFLKTIHCPVLLLVGREDRWSPVSQHEEIKNDLSNARLIIIDNAGHFAPIEQSEVVSAAILQWLEALVLS